MGSDAAAGSAVRERWRSGGRSRERHARARTQRASAAQYGDLRRGAGTPSARLGGMTLTAPTANSLPHHKLIAYQLALALVTLVARTRIADAQLRQQARKSAVSAALNTAEGAARQTLADKSRMYAIALAECCECCECCAAVEIAGALGACAQPQVHAIVELGTRLKNVLSRLVR